MIIVVKNNLQKGIEVYIFCITLIFYIHIIIIFCFSFSFNGWTVYCEFESSCPCLVTYSFRTVSPHCTSPTKCGCRAELKRKSKLQIPLLLRLNFCGENINWILMEIFLCNYTIMKLPLNAYCLHIKLHLIWREHVNYRQFIGL